MLGDRLAFHYLFDSSFYWLALLENWLTLLVLFQLVSMFCLLHFLEALGAHEVSVVITVKLVAVVAENGSLVVVVI